MSEKENYRTTQTFLVIAIFGLLALAMINGNLFITVGSVLAAAALALYASTTQPAACHDDHGHHH